MDHLVTGGGGFIGSNLVRGLLEKGDSVSVLDNFATGRRENLDGLAGRVEVVEADIRDMDAVQLAMQGVRNVFHLAALPSVARSVADPVTSNDVNVGGIVKVLTAAKDEGVARFVFASSSSVYGNLAELPKREDMTPTPLSPYAVQKLTGEHYCRIFCGLYGLRTYALRYFNVFGPRQNPESQYAAVIPMFIKRLRDGLSPVIHGDGEQTRDFTYVEDVVGATICASEAPDEAAGGVYNVAWGNRTSINEITRSLIEITGCEVQPVHDEPRGGDVRDSQADSTRAREILGWSPKVELKDGLKMTAEWFTG